MNAQLINFRRFQKIATIPKLACKPCSTKQIGVTPYSSRPIPCVLALSSTRKKVIILFVKTPSSFDPELKPDTVTPHRWIVLRTDIDEDLLPPEGVRVNPQLHGNSMAVIQYSNSNMRPMDNLPVIGTKCVEQGYYFHPFQEYADTFEKFPMYWCGFSEDKKTSVLGATYDGSSITLTVSDASSIVPDQRAYVDGLQVRTRL